MPFTKLCSRYHKMKRQLHSDIETTAAKSLKKEVDKPTMDWAIPADKVKNLVKKFDKTESSDDRDSRKLSSHAATKFETSNGELNLIISMIFIA